MDWCSEILYVKRWEESFKLILWKPTPTPREQKCAVYILLLRLRPRQGGCFSEIVLIRDKCAKYIKFVQEWGFFKAGRCFVYKMKSPKFVRTNLMIDPHFLKSESLFALWMVPPSAAYDIYSFSIKTCPVFFSTFRLWYRLWL